MNRIVFGLLFVLLSLGSAQGLSALPFSVDFPFGSQMVLPSGVSFKLSGKGEPSSRVTAMVQQEVFQSNIDSSGRWEIHLAPLEATNEPFSIQLQSGNQSLILDNLLCGDLILASGQSNMLMSVAESDVKKDLNSTALRLPIRILKVSVKKGGEIEGVWEIPSRKKVASFSAIGWSLAVGLTEKTGKATGIIEYAIGGAPVEAFLPPEIASSFLLDGKSWRESDDYPRWCRSRAGQDPTVLFGPSELNSGLNTILQLPLTALIWYQGESNAPEDVLTTYTGGYELTATKQKYQLFFNYIRTIQSRALPICWIELPQMNRNWQPFRSMQKDLCDELDLLLIPAADTGDLYNVHPKQKQILGMRTAQAIYDYFRDTNQPIQTLLN